MEIFLLGLCALAFAKGSWDLGRVLLLQWQGAMESDAHLYFTVGRGILNGLTPYVDLYETKPPGMFLLAVLSLVLSGGQAFALILQTGVILLIPGLLGWYAWVEHAGTARRIRMLTTAVAALLGILISLYLDERAGGIQTESFGTFFTFLYLLCLLRFGEQLSWKRIGVLAALLLCAIGLKEPFLLAALAAVLLIITSLRQCIRGFLLPLGIAAVAGTILLALLGWLIPYLDIYLPSVISERVGTNRFEPLWLRGFMATRLYGNLTTYYTAPVLGYILAILWALFPALRAKTFGWQDLTLAGVTSVLTYYILWIGGGFLLMWSVARMGYETPPGFVPISGLQYTLLFLLWCGLLVLQYRRGLLLGTALMTGTLYLATFAISISVFANNHFAAAVPVYLALALAVFRSSASLSRLPWVLIGIAAMTTIGIALYQPKDEHLKLLHDRMGYTAADSRAYAGQVDALLDACGVERYYGFGTFQRLAFARHSPWGPLFQMPFFEFLGLDHPLYEQTFRHLADDVPLIIVYRDTWFRDMTAASLSEIYTQEPPACALPFLPLPESQLFFRKGTWEAAQ